MQWHRVKCSQYWADDAMTEMAPPTHRESGLHADETRVMAGHSSYGEGNNDWIALYTRPTSRTALSFAVPLFSENSIGGVTAAEAGADVEDGRAALSGAKSYIAIPVVFCAHCSIILLLTKSLKKPVPPANPSLPGVSTVPKVVTAKPLSALWMEL